MKNEAGEHRQTVTVGLIGKLLIVLVTSALTVYLVKDTDHIHTPFFAAVVGAIALGYVEPKSGYWLALIQCGAMLVGYLLIAGVGEEGARRELETFSLIGSMLLTFVASFMGAFMKRAIDS